MLLEKREKKILSQLDLEMQQILNSDQSSNEKMQLYNQVLQKIKLFQKKIHSKPKHEDTKLPDSAIKKKSKVRQFSKNIKVKKNLSFDDKSQIISNERVIPGSNTNQLFQPVLKKRNPTLPGMHEVKNLLCESL